MSVRAALFNRVASVAAITTILGTDPVRFRWSNVPQGEQTPYSRYFQVSRTRTRGHDGPAGLSLVTVQVEHYAPNPDDVEALADAFTANLDSTNNGTLTLLMENETDAFQVHQSLWQINQDWQAQWRE